MTNGQFMQIKVSATKSSIQQRDQELSDAEAQGLRAARFCSQNSSKTAAPALRVALDVSRNVLLNFSSMVFKISYRAHETAAL